MAGANSYWAGPHWAVTPLTTIAVFLMAYEFAMNGICVFPQNSYDEILTTNVIVLGDGAFGR